MVFQRGAVAADDATYDDERDESPCCAAEEEGLSADFVDEEERGQCGERVDYAVDACCE